MRDLRARIFCVAQVLTCLLASTIVGAEPHQTLGDQPHFLFRCALKKLPGDKFLVTPQSAFSTEITGSKGNDFGFSPPNPRGKKSARGTKECILPNAIGLNPGQSFLVRTAAGGEWDVVIRYYALSTPVTLQLISDDVEKSIVLPAASSKTTGLRTARVTFDAPLAEFVVTYSNSPTTKANSSKSTELFVSSVKLVRLSRRAPTGTPESTRTPKPNRTDTPKPGTTTSPGATPTSTNVTPVPTVNPSATPVATPAPPTPTPAATASHTRTFTPAAGPSSTPTQTRTPTATAGEQSPTGRNPRLLWTPEQQAVWSRMRAENHPWWLVVEDAANRTGTASENYNDYGQWAATAYQVTGNSVYAQKAFNELSGKIAANPGTRNETREYFAEAVILYDWLYPGLTESQRTILLDKLKGWAELVLAPGGGWGTRTGDSDETTGHYFGLALLDVLTGSNYLSRTWNDGGAGTMKSVGGLSATGTTNNTMRNAISWFISGAKGGQWIESSEYNVGTVQLLLMGTQAIKTATGIDYFPEATAFFKEAAINELYEMTSDHEDSYQWGDVERTRYYIQYGRTDKIALLSGVTKNEPQIGPYMNRLLRELLEKFGHTGYGSGELHQPRGIFLYNPYGPEADWRTTLPSGHFAAGRGIALFHNGWGAGNTLFGAQMTSPMGVDHEHDHFGDFQLYRKGDWALTHPLGYAGPAATGAGTNSMLIAGLSSMNSRKVVAQAFGPNQDWAYMAGVTNGQHYWTGYYDPPPTFLHEWTRSLLYLPSTDGKSDTVVVFDRVNADNPENLPKLDRYYPDARGAITSSPALKQWVIHSPVAPTVAADGISWATAGGQQVKVSTLQPASQNRTVYNETTLWGGTWHFHPSELKYHVRIAPASEQKWDTFLNVVQAYDSGTALQNVLVQSVGGEVSGVQLKRGGHSDTLVLFGARESARVLSAGYGVEISAGTASTELFLMDLDPARAWSVRVNGGSAQTITVNSAGVGRVSINGTGAQSIAIGPS